MLVLGDNFETVLCSERKRACDYNMLVQVRRACSLCLCRNVRVHYRWVPSELNSGDEGSRVFDSAASKTLTHYIEDIWAHKARHRQSPSFEQCSTQAVSRRVDGTLYRPLLQVADEDAIDNPQDAQDPEHG